MKIGVNGAGSRWPALWLLLAGSAFCPVRSWADTIGVPEIHLDIPPGLEGEHCRLLLGAAGRKARTLAKIAPLSVEETRGFAEMPGVVNNAYLVCRALMSPEFEEALLIGVKKNVADVANEWTPPGRGQAWDKYWFAAKLSALGLVREKWDVDSKFPVPQFRSKGKRVEGTPLDLYRLRYDKLLAHIDHRFVDQAGDLAAQWAKESNIPFDRATFERDLRQTMEHHGRAWVVRLVKEPSFCNKLQALFHGNYKNTAIRQLLSFARDDERKKAPRGTNIIHFFELGPRGPERDQKETYGVHIRDDGKAMIWVSYPRTSGSSSSPKGISPEHVQHYYSLPNSLASNAPARHLYSMISYGLPSKMRESKRATGNNRGITQWFDAQGGPSTLHFSLGRGDKELYFDYRLSGKPGRPRVRLVEFGLFSWDPPITASDGRKTRKVRLVPVRLPKGQTKKGHRAFVALTHEMFRSPPHGTFPFFVRKRRGERSAARP